MTNKLPDKVVSITWDHIDKGNRYSRLDSLNNPVALAFSYEYDRSICVARGPSTMPLDKRSAHRLWTAYLGNIDHDDDLVLPEEFQSFMNWWTYGRNSLPETFDIHVKPISMRISR